MTWVTFFAGRGDLLELLRFVYDETDCQVREAYSAPDCESRIFPSLESVAKLSELGSWPEGPPLALWSPQVGALPVVRRIDFKPGAIPGHTHRFVVEGCSLVTLQCGGVGKGMLHVSHLGWWTEVSARAKANPKLGADRVDWRALASLGRRLRYQVERRLAVGIAGRRAVLRDALAISQSGLGLHDDRQPLAVLSVDTA